MSLPEVFARFVDRSPVPVMIHGVLEYVFDSKALDCIFNTFTKRQHTRELLYSTVVELMALVVTRVEKSLGSAIRSRQTDLPVLPKAVYEKIAGLEPEVISATLAVTAAEMEGIIEQMSGQPAPLVPGLRTLILDGNHLKAVEHRLKPLRDQPIAALPGASVALLDHRLRLFLRTYLLEDGHASERTVLEEVASDLKPQDLLIVDRNFAVTSFGAAVEDRGAFFLMREHKTNFPVRLVGERALQGHTSTGTVCEQQGFYNSPDGERGVRRITVELDSPTRNRERQLHIVTNVPAEKLDACGAAEAYRQRWTIETGFQTMTVDLHCELSTLGYPPAALFAFCVAAMAYNAYSTARAALNSRYGADRMQQELSTYYLANEIRKVWAGMRVAIDDNQWQMAFGKLNREQLVAQLLELADRVDLAYYKKAPTRKRSPPRKRARTRTKHRHVSVDKILRTKR